MSKRETYTHRPMQVSDEVMQSNWERIFGKPEARLPDVSDGEGDGKEVVRDSRTANDRSA